jgi:hypothetical protein
MEENSYNVAILEATNILDNFQGKVVEDATTYLKDMDGYVRTYASTVNEIVSSIESLFETWNANVNSANNAHDLEQLNKAQAEAVADAHSNCDPDVECACMSIHAEIRRRQAINRQKEIKSAIDANHVREQILNKCSNLNLTCGDLRDFVMPEDTGDEIEYALLDISDAVENYCFSLFTFYTEINNNCTDRINKLKSSMISTNVCVNINKDFEGLDEFCQLVRFKMYELNEKKRSFQEEIKNFLGKVLDVEIEPAQRKDIDTAFEKTINDPNYDNKDLIIAGTNFVYSLVDTGNYTLSQAEDELIKYLSKRCTNEAEIEVALYSIKDITNIIRDNMKKGGQPYESTPNHINSVEEPSEIPTTIDPTPPNHINSVEEPSEIPTTIDPTPLNHINSVEEPSEIPTTIDPTPPNRINSVEEPSEIPTTIDPTPPNHTNSVEEPSEIPTTIDLTPPNRINSVDESSEIPPIINSAASDYAASAAVSLQGLTQAPSGLTYIERAATKSHNTFANAVESTSDALAEAAQDPSGFVNNLAKEAVDATVKVAEKMGGSKAGEAVADVANDIGSFLDKAGEQVDNIFNKNK